MKEFSCAEPTGKNGAELQKQLKEKKVKSCAEKNKQFLCSGGCYRINQGSDSLWGSKREWYGGVCFVVVKD